jgi:hypothetical protein
LLVDPLVVGSFKVQLAWEIPTEVPTGGLMPLTDTFLKNKTKHTGEKLSGDKHSDGGGLYLHVTAAGKYWRMNYRMAGKQKTLSLGIYPAVSLASARRGRDKAKELLAQGQDCLTSTILTARRQLSWPVEAGNKLIGLLC